MFTGEEPSAAMAANPNEADRGQVLPWRRQRRNRDQGLRFVWSQELGCRERVPVVPVESGVAAVAASRGGQPGGCWLREASGVTPLVAIRSRIDFPLPFGVIEPTVLLFLDISYGICYML